MLKVKMSALVFLIAFVSISAPRFYSVDSNTIALWRFNEGEGKVALDFSGNNNHAEIFGCTWAKGQFGRCLQFNGIDNYVSVPHSVSLVSVTSAITIEAIVWADSFNAQWSHILDKPHTYALSFNAGTPAFSACGVGNECWWIPGNYHSPTGRWVRIAAQFDGRKRQIYVNDTLVSEISATGTIQHMDQYSLSELVIGAGNIKSLRVGETGYFFKGKIDEIRISNIPRYTSKKEYYKLDSHTLALWRFNEQSGDTAYDVSPYKNNTVITGASRVNGLYGGALSFNGIDNFAAAPHSNSLVALNNAITIEAVVKARSFSSSWSHILDKPHTYGISFNNAQLALSICGTTKGCWRTPELPKADTGKWLHVATQYDGTKMQVYIDSVLVAQEFNSGAVSHMSGYPLSEIVIGAGNLRSYRVGSTGYFFNGKIDEIRLSDTARYGAKAITGILKENKTNAMSVTGISTLVKSSNVSISYFVTNDGPVDIDIFTVSGSIVKSFKESFQAYGLHTIRWDARNYSGQTVPAGTYFIRFKSLTGNAYSKIMLTR